MQQEIPLNQLIVSPDKVRTLSPEKKVDKELIASIRTVPPHWDDDDIISAALQILESRITYHVDKAVLGSPDESKEYVKLQLAERPYEVFACLFLDNRHRVITFEELFRGTLDGCSVHPREVVKAALAHNAAAAVLCHNHPSGNAEPSQADRRITKRLQDALSLVDVRVLDHLVVGQEVVSFAERGWV